MRTRAPHRHTQRDRITRKCLTVALPPKPAPFPSVKMLEQLAGAADWRGVAAQERAARAVAAAVRTWMPGYASFVYSALGNAYQNLGSFSKALEHHKEHLTMAKEAQSTRRWHISKSTSRGACNGDVTLAAGEDRRGARTRRCSRAAAAV
jgi:hypothetical protein